MDVFEEIENLPRWLERKCDCGTLVKTCCLQIYSKYPSCGSEAKQRSFGGIGTESQDIVDAVLKWAETGKGLQSLINTTAWQ